MLSVRHKFCFPVFNSGSDLANAKISIPSFQVFQIPHSHGFLLLDLISRFCRYLHDYRVMIRICCWNTFSVYKFFRYKIIYITFWFRSNPHRFIVADIKITSYTFIKFLYFSVLWLTFNKFMLKSQKILVSTLNVLMVRSFRLSQKFFE